ncbi:tripartite tricarboxylate transporter TctB family protein [Hydrogenophaga sp.]|uniref:tripartite tricarboxylate transporter TctB family protein n=1 Tax=Hydrogenophaga sp. TaxID=1904254 RepID=UPI0035626ABA
MSDRIFGGFVLALSVLMMWGTTLIQESFIQDPLGPKVFPLVIAGVMAVTALYMLVKPDPEPKWPGLYKLIELVVTVGVLAAYAQFLPIIGFVFASSLASAYLSWRLGATVVQSLVSGLLISVGLYGVFHWLLGLSLAKGPWGF